MRMQRCITALLVTAALCVSLPACSGPGQSAGPADSGKTLTLCTESLYNDTAKRLAEYYEDVVQKDKPKGEKLHIAVEVLPEAGEEQEPAFKRMRTELMAGKGPDMFLLSTPRPNRSQQEASLSLFPDINKIMRNGVLADMSAYTKADASFAECAPAIMQAGQLDGKQLVLPLAFGFHMYGVEKQALAQSGMQLADFNKPAKAYYQSLLQAKGSSSLVQQLDRRLYPGLYPFYSQMIDYEKQKPFPTQAQLEQEIAEEKAYRLQRGSNEPGGDAQGEAAEQPPLTVKLTSNKLNAASDLIRGGQAGLEYAMAPCLTEDGKPLGLVSLYAAVRGNCSDPQAAYSFLRLFLSKEVQSGKGYAQQEGTNANGEAYSSRYGGQFPLDDLPVNTKGLDAMDMEEESNRDNPQVLANIKAYRALIKQVQAGHARLLSQADLALDFTAILTVTQDAKKEMSPQQAAKALYSKLQAQAGD